MSEEEKQLIEVINEKIEDINNMPINTKNKSTIKFLVEVQKVANELVDIANEIIDNQQKEIEEKSTIIMVGAEKVKQLEKGNRSLMESRIKWKNRYYKEKEKNKENQVLIDDIKDHRIVYIDTPEFEEKFISKDKIREKIKKYDEWIKQGEYVEDLEAQRYALNELLEEN